MLKKRPDGRLVKTVPPIMKIMPYIMKTRTDSMNMYDDVFDCEVWDSYIKEKEAEGIKMSYMHILIAGVVRMIALRPQLNRFIMNGRVYTRHKIYVSFVVHPKLCDGDAETTIKLEFEGTETIQEIAEVINRRIKEETTDRQGENGTDKLARVLTFVPAPLIRLAVNTLMWMDRHNLLPKAIIDLSPFHTSFFITNLKSLGINYIFHHTYEFGTTGMFFAIGKEQNRVVLDKDGNLENEKRMGWGLVTDERFCDGLYFALSLRQLRKFMKNPKLLEEPLEAKVEDVE
ncbi:MAG: 2-oxoglutarate dehydrogenase [Lachnospiraceae bacterium]|nr:2-oxoglutarate dehydrogenase [Lachnospiraceae bacterium]MBQ8632705.1 2-oxoglutarate dehydrogenase [Lachnospiraceae bacterium]